MPGSPHLEVVHQWDQAFSTQKIHFQFKIYSMRKKILIILMALMAVTLPLMADENSASDNFEKIYPIDDEIVQDLKDLYILSGLSLPSTTGPYSGSELKMALKRLDYASLGSFEKSLYDRIEGRLMEDAASAVFTVDLAIIPEIYMHSNTSKTFQTWDNWIIDWADSPPALSFVMEQHIGRNFYGFFDFSIGTTKTKAPYRETAFGDRIWESNIPIDIMNNLDFNFPYRAFVAAGGENWSLEVGRERYSWGPGQTGNFILGDHIKYHNSARITAFDDNFKYTFLVLSFIHPQNYYYAAEGGKSSLHPNGKDGQSSYLNGISAFIAHRLEWRFLDDKLGFVLTEGVMYMSKDNRIDLIAISPAHLFHNSYTRSLTNSILSFEFDWTVMKGLNIYTQIVVDEMILPGEPVPGKEGADPAEPTSMGYMLGATYDMALSDGILSFNLEGAYTDPYLYLRDGNSQVEDGNGRNQEEGEWGINFVVPTREMVKNGGTQYFDEQFLGYKYGGDAIVAQLSVNYRKPGNWMAGGRFFYMAHGTHDQWTVWTQVNRDYHNVSTPTDEHQTGNHKDSNAKDRNAVSHTFDIGFDGSIILPYGFSVGTSLDFVSILNAGNIKSYKVEFDVQWSFAVGWSL